jgi:hypothetical protein
MTTKHTCGGPVFGRRTAGCPRCDDLLAGARPVTRQAREDRERTAWRALEIRAHFTSWKHRSGGCGPVCTFGDW